MGPGRRGGRRVWILGGADGGGGARGSTLEGESDSCEEGC